MNPGVVQAIDDIAVDSPTPAAGLACVMSACVSEVKSGESPVPAQTPFAPICTPPLPLSAVEVSGCEPAEDACETMKVVARVEAAGRVSGVHLEGRPTSQATQLCVLAKMQEVKFSPATLCGGGTTAGDWRQEFAAICDGVVSLPQKAMGRAK